MQAIISNRPGAVTSGSSISTRQAHADRLFAEIAHLKTVTHADADAFVERRIDEADAERQGRGWALSMIDAVTFDEGAGPDGRMLVAMFAATSSDVLDEVTDWSVAKAAAWALLAIHAKRKGDDERAQVWMARAERAADPAGELHSIADRIAELSDQAEALNMGAKSMRAETERIGTPEVLAYHAAVRGSHYEGIRTAVNLFVADERATEQGRECAKSVWFDVVTRGESGLTRAELRANRLALSALGATLAGDIPAAERYFRDAERVFAHADDPAETSAQDDAQ